MEADNGHSDSEDVGIVCESCGHINTPRNLCEHYTVIQNNVIETEDQANSLEELLISLVEARPPLWDSRLPLKDRSKGSRDFLWKEIFEALGGAHSIEVLQRKWKNLRDTYLRYKGEVEGYIMQFLSETVAPRSTISSMESPTATNPLGSSNVETTSIKGSRKIENQILEAIQKLPPPPPYKESREINPICIQLSNILEQLPTRKRANLEISFLSQAYAAFHDQ